MSPRARYLATSGVLAALAAAYLLWQGQITRPAPHLPASSAMVARRAPPSPAPRAPGAREILGHAMALDLSDDQVARLRALDRRWSAEVSRLEAAIRQAEEEVSAFMEDARARGASIQEIQQRSADLRSLGALLREGRRRHADAAVGLLADWQRRRVDGAGVDGGETGRH